MVGRVICPPVVVVFSGTEVEVGKGNVGRVLPGPPPPPPPPPSVLGGPLPSPWSSGIVVSWSPGNTSFLLRTVPRLICCSVGTVKLSSMPSVATCMYFFQMVAGNEPPVATLPCTSRPLRFIGQIRPSNPSVSGSSQPASPVSG